MRPTSTIALPWLLGPHARRTWLGLLVAQIVVVCWLAFSPEPPPAADTGWDKANHALAFSVMSCTAEFAIWPLRARRWITVTGLLGLGGLIEGVQTRIPGRSGEWPDLLADGVGIALGLLAAAWLLALLGARRH